MTHDKKFKNESQDARRRDKHNATHPDEKGGIGKNKTEQNQNRDSHLHSDKSK